MNQPMDTSNQSNRYAIGIDFGTLSVRAAVVSLENGSEAGAATFNYPNAVIEKNLPGSTNRLKTDTALQCPDDYLEGLKSVVPQAIQKAGISKEAIVGIGVDFTSCTVMVTTSDGTPLSKLPEFQSNPHAWVKLWKHHAAQPEADFINHIASERNEKFLPLYGGKYSSEWFFSKVLETLREAPDVYESAGRFIEAGDWMVWQLTGSEKRCISAAGFKSMVVYESGDGSWTYPPKEFFKSLHPDMENIVTEKLSGEFLPLGMTAGKLTPAMAETLGLQAGIPVAPANIDAHVAVPACQVSGPETLVMIMGTSTCHLLVSDEKYLVEGMCGVVRDGVLPGYWGYEAGQAGVGDCFAWFMKNACPESVNQEADRLGLDTYEYLESLAAKLKVGESGLVALDWWNGNRSVLVDADLSGLILGISMTTEPHEIYRALMEATAFGTRRIIEAFTDKGVPIKNLIACGGLAKKNPLLMQIYADVTGRPIRIAASDQTCALGSAMFAAVAAGAFASIKEATEVMAHLEAVTYLPNPENHQIYNEIYCEYLKLHDFFGRNPSGPMKTLKALRKRILK